MAAFVLTTLDISIGDKKYQPTSLSHVERGEDVFDRLESFIASKLVETDIEDVDPKTPVVVNINAKWGVEFPRHVTPKAGFNGIAETLSDIPPHFRDKIKNRAEAAAFIATEGFVKMVAEFSSVLPS